MLWLIDLQEDIENGIPSFLQVALAMLTLAKDVFMWNSSSPRPVDCIALVMTFFQCRYGR